MPPTTGCSKPGLAIIRDGMSGLGVVGVGMANTLFVIPMNKDRYRVVAIPIERMIVKYREFRFISSSPI
jgi:hypothetical protein